MDLDALETRKPKTKPSMFKRLPYPAPPRTSQDLSPPNRSLASPLFSYSEFGKASLFAQWLRAPRCSAYENPPRFLTPPPYIHCMINAIFLNLPIENLKRSVDFFSGLGFKFNEQFTSEDSTCMLVGENIYAMLLEHKRFESFIDKKIADKDTVEVLISLSCESPDEVRTLSKKAFELGGRQLNDEDDKGFMFSWGFEDLDGHIWDLFWMDPAHIQ